MSDGYDLLYWDLFSKRLVYHAINMDGGKSGEGKREGTVARAGSFPLPISCSPAPPIIA